MLPLIWWEVLLLWLVKVSPSFIWSLQTTHRLVPHLKLPCWMGEEFTSVRGGTLARTISHASCGDVCRPEQESQELHAEDDLNYEGCDGCHSLCCGKEGGWGGKWLQGDSAFGGIIDGFLFQRRGSGNRTSSVDGLLYFLSAVCQRETRCILRFCVWREK